MSGSAAANVGAAVLRRILSIHKPFVRLARRASRDREQRAFREDAAAVDREIAQIAAGSEPIILGPWLAEVGYEVLYWLPFLRWFQDRFGIRRERLIAVSRGGVRDWYDPIAAAYVDIFDVITPELLAARNQQRHAQEERGGLKQSRLGALDDDLLAAARDRLGITRARVCHPSLMFRLFRNVWHHNLPMDLLWRRTRYLAPPFAVTPLPSRASLPPAYIAAKLYTGVAIPGTDNNQRALRSLITKASTIAPVVLLDTNIADDHAGVDLAGIPNVINASGMMTPRDNLAVQTGVIAGAALFIGTCGGLAWVAPFLGIPTIAVYEDDQLLDMHLMVASQARKRVNAATFSTVDLRAWRRLDLST